MDSQKKDELSDRKCEQALARLMGEALDRLASRDSSECPDAEVIAAYQDQALDPSEMSQCESHFSGCARCRKILALLAASTDAPLAEKEVARLGELMAAAGSPLDPASQSKIAARSQKLPWKTRWLAPALGIAAVLALWFAMRPPWRSQEQPATGTLIAQAPRSEPPQDAPIPPVKQFSQVVPEKKSERNSVTGNDQPLGKNQLSNSPAEPFSKSRSEAGNAVGRVTPSAGVDENKFYEMKTKPQATSAPAATTPSSPAPASLQEQARRDSSAMEAPRTETQQGVVGGVLSAKEATAGAAANEPATDKKVLSPDSISSGPLNGRSYTNLAALDAAGRSNVLVKTPLGTILWRVGRGGGIQRSADAGGGTWISQISPLQEDWLAGAAVSDTTCWIVGRNGAIARTTDGEHWEKIAPPALISGPAGKLPDWISVTASGTQRAAITAADQRRFTTQDGGKSWQAQ